MSVDFAAKVSAIDPHAMARRTWQFVDIERGGAGNGPGGANTGATGGTAGEVWLSSKLRYREDSPFAGWLREQTSSERLDALCVDGIDDSDHAVRQVQADGQIKSGKRGQHGIKDRQQVIGFVNESYLAQLRTRIQDAQRQCDETAQSYASAKEQADRLQRERELADQLAYTAWEKIDENEREGGDRRHRTHHRLGQEQSQARRTRHVAGVAVQGARPLAAPAHRHRTAGRARRSGGERSAGMARRACRAAAAADAAARRGSGGRFAKSRHERTGLPDGRGGGGARRII